MRSRSRRCRCVTTCCNVSSRFLSSLSSNTFSIVRCLYAFTQPSPDTRCDSAAARWSWMSASIVPRMNMRNLDARSSDLLDRNARAMSCVTMVSGLSALMLRCFSTCAGLCVGTCRPVASIAFHTLVVRVRRLSRMMRLPKMLGSYASGPMLNSVTRTRASSLPVRMNCARLAARPVWRADTPRHACSACMIADLPLPFCPDTSVTCGPSTTSNSSWHMKFSRRMLSRWPARSCWSVPDGPAA
mmetsp:Transcript_40175/g.119742  ORF Transcript_40175/g.119742 Transcript_40175/m.119742 type:complete len:243 (-) Transcript_40175:1032-1760(-)